MGTSPSSIQLGLFNTRRSTHNRSLSPSQLHEVRRCPCHLPPRPHLGLGQHHQQWRRRGLLQQQQRRGLRHLHLGRHRHHQDHYHHQDRLGRPQLRSADRDGDPGAHRRAHHAAHRHPRGLHRLRLRGHLRRLGSRALHLLLNLSHHHLRGLIDRYLSLPHTAAPSSSCPSCWALLEEQVHFSSKKK